MENRHHTFQHLLFLRDEQLLAYEFQRQTRKVSPTFHYSLFPHNGFDETFAIRKGMERNQPLIVAPAVTDTVVEPLFTIGNQHIILSTMKPSEDGKGIMLRLYNASDQKQLPEINWKR
jgi:alpha-mannosidase